MYNQLQEIAALVGPSLEGRLNNYPRLADHIQGLLVEFDRFWLVRYFEELLCLYYAPRDLAQSQIFERRDIISALHRRRSPSLDIDFRPPEWDSHCKTAGYPNDASPVRFRVILRNPLPPHSFVEIPTSHEGYPVLYEVRPECISLAATQLDRAHKSDGRVSHGDKISYPGAQGYGTLGGFLENAQDNIHYATSCAHVLGKPDDLAAVSRRKFFNSYYLAIGRVTDSYHPAAQSVDTTAHPFLTSVDCALVKLFPEISTADAEHDRPDILTVDTRQTMCQGQRARFCGATSGTMNIEFGSLCIWIDIVIKGVRTPFRNLFEIKPIRPWYINSSLARPGDSGAWILSATPLSLGWSGMIVGGDGAHAYCTFAEDVLGHLQSRGLGKLRVATCPKIPQVRNSPLYSNVAAAIRRFFSRS